MLRELRSFGVRGAIIGLLAVVLPIALGACSALRIGYGTGPDVAYWWIDRYIDFEGDQTPRARETIAQWFDWHRRTQLPDYAAQLAKARVEVLADITPARACAWQGELTKRAHLAFDQIAPGAAAILPTITPRQIAYLEQRYDKGNQQYRQDFLQPDPRQRAEESLKRVVERAESLYGRLDAGQRARIAETLTRSPFDPELWLAERRQRQQDALRILRAASGGGNTPAQALQALNGYVDRLEHSPRDAYQRYAARLNEFNCAFAAEVQKRDHADPAAHRGGSAGRVGSRPAGDSVARPSRGNAEP